MIVDLKKFSSERVLLWDKTSNESMKLDICSLDGRRMDAVGVGGSGGSQQGGSSQQL